MSWAACLAAWIPRHARHGQDVALGDGVTGHFRGRLGLHVHPAAGHGTPVRGVLRSDVDHASTSQWVKVCQAVIGHRAILCQTVRWAHLGL